MEVDIKFRINFVMLIVISLLGAVNGLSQAEEVGSEKDMKIEKLEQMIEQLSAEVDELKKQVRKEKQEDTLTTFQAQQQLELEKLQQDMDEMKKSKELKDFFGTNHVTLGGYGEMHANFGEGSEKDVFDFHRLVLYLGYDFADWIKLHTETELEHAFASDDSGGEVVVEQAYIDFLLLQINRFMKLERSGMVQRKKYLDIMWKRATIFGRKNGKEINCKMRTR